MIRRIPWLLALALLGAAGPGLADDDPLASCKQANDDFEFENVVSACQVALDGGGLDDTQRVEAYRLLAIAEVSLNHEEAAEGWFLKLLLLDPAHDLGAGVSPVFRESFEKAKKKLEQEGQVKAALTLSIDQEGRGPWPATVALTDPLGRVKGGALLVRAVRGGAETGRRVVELERSGDTLKGSVEDPTPVELEGSYQLEVQLTVNDSAGHAIALGDAVAPMTFPREGAAAEGGGMGTGLWIGIGGGGAAAAAVVVVIGGGAAVVAGCVITGLCTGGEGERSSHVRVGPAL
jgi:hypothetical protein